MDARAYARRNFTPAPISLQRKCACGNRANGGECGDCARKRMQRKPADLASKPKTPSVVGHVLRNSGQPLDSDTRRVMEDHFSHDFSRVRVHTDASAAESARAVHAHAYTVGNNVVFGAGRYAPAAPDGQHLLAHELTHVVQQQRGRGTGLQRLADESVEDDAPENPALEQEADTMADALAKGKRKGSGHKRNTKKKEAPKNPCTRTIFSEGTCQHLVDKAAGRCCDPDNGLENEHHAKDVDKKDCPSHKFTPMFTCDNDCATALSNGCDDDDHWMAVPRNQFTKAQCGDKWTICANGTSTWGYVRDKSVTQSRFEVSPGIQKALGVPVGGSFKGSVFKPGASQAAIDKDACCNKPQNGSPGKSGDDAKDAQEAEA